MTRTCATCGSTKTGEEAKIKPNDHDGWWNKMHKPGCEYLKVSELARTSIFMEQGTPLSSVIDE